MKPELIITHLGNDDQDFIEAQSLGYDKDRFYIHHHY